MNEGVMIQVRNVPETLHRELLERARARGQTLTAYIQEILEHEVARPPARKVFDRVRGRQSVDLGAPASELIRGEREHREDA